jgi:hypothetical protein
MLIIKTRGINMKLAERQLKEIIEQTNKEPRLNFKIDTLYLGLINGVFPNNKPHFFSSNENQENQNANVITTTGLKF